MKSIQLTQSQIEAYENGGSMLLFPIIVKIERLNSETDVTFYCEEENRFKFLNKREFIKMYSPLQKGDKEVWVKEDLVLCKQCGEMIYQFNYHKNPKCPKCGESFITEKAFQSASQMTKEQSRYSIKEVIDVRVVKMGELTYEQLEEFNIGLDMNEKILDKRLFNNGLTRNDYIFLVEIKK